MYSLPVGDTHYFCFPEPKTLSIFNVAVIRDGRVDFKCAQDEPPMVLPLDPDIPVQLRGLYPGAYYAYAEVDHARPKKAPSRKPRQEP